MAGAQKRSMNVVGGKKENEREKVPGRQPQLATSVLPGRPVNPKNHFGTIILKARNVFSVSLTFVHLQHLLTCHKNGKVTV